MRTVLLVHAASTLAMVGVIWIVQLVQYPGFLEVGASEFRAYHAAHSQRISLIVGPLMAIEGVTALWLLVARPAAIPLWAVVAGLVLLAVALGTTMVVSVPLHGTLANGWDAEAIGRLVRTNWIRTVAWTARGALALWFVSLAR
ncbi:MAG: hypothetical protein ACKOKE_00030 [Actinomycetota bacterium]